MNALGFQSCLWSLGKFVELHFKIRLNLWSFMNVTYSQSVLLPCTHSCSYSEIGQTFLRKRNIWKKEAKERKMGRKRNKNKDTVHDVDDIIMDFWVKNFININKIKLLSGNWSPWYCRWYQIKEWFFTPWTQKASSKREKTNLFQTEGEAKILH